MRSQPIGVFDSGVGGISVLKHIRAALPHEDLLYLADSKHAPYGNKSPEFIRERAFALSDFLISQGAKALVVACNTATAAAIEALRKEYGSGSAEKPSRAIEVQGARRTETGMYTKVHEDFEYRATQQSNRVAGLSAFPLPIIGMEPAIKPAAAATRTGVVGVLATVGTLKSAQFAALLESYGQNLTVVTEGCPGLVECIERGELESPATAALLETYLQPLLQAGADTIVLGCTHYLFVRPVIEQMVGPEVILIDTGAAVAKHLKTRLQEASLLADAGQSGRVKFWSNSKAKDVQQVIPQLWGTDVAVLELLGR